MKIRTMMYEQVKTSLQITHWGRDEMDNISQTTFPNVFSSLKMFELRLQQYSNIGSDNGLAPTRRQAIVWTNAG